MSSRSHSSIKTGAGSGQQDSHRFSPFTILGAFCYLSATGGDTLLRADKSRGIWPYFDDPHPPNCYFGLMPGWRATPAWWPRVVEPEKIQRLGSGK